jgi:hypothetical protein
VHTTAPRWRRVTAWSIAGLLVLLVPVTAVAVWARGQLLDTDRFLRAVGPVIEEPAVQTALAAATADSATAALQRRLATELPPELRPVAPVLTGQLEPFVQRKVLEVLDAPATARVWQTATALTHEQLVRVLRGDSRLLLAAQQGVVVDLTGISGEVSAALADRGIPVAEGGRTVRLVLLDGETLTQVQRAVGLLDTAATALPWVVLLLAVAAIALHPRRAAALLLLGLGGGATVLLLALALGQGAYIGTLPDEEVTRAGAGALADLLLAGLRLAGRALLVLAVLGASVTWLLTSTRPGASRLRSAARTAWLRAAPWSRPAGVAIVALTLVTLLVVDVLTPLRAGLLATLAALGVTLALRRVEGSPAAGDAPTATT